MPRNSNDDRADSMNPNNSSYHASEANRAEQLGLDDDSDSAADSNVPPTSSFGCAQTVEKKATKPTRIRLSPAPEGPRPEAIRAMFVRT